VKRIANCIVEVVDLNSDKIPVYSRRHIPYTEMCEEYCKAHLFLVTHEESVGLSALEAALAGALVVAPTGYMNKDVLATVRSVEYLNKIPWKFVLKEINPKASHAKALTNSWSLVAEKMMVYWKGYKAA
jgi:hypothetical protein